MKQNKNSKKIIVVAIIFIALIAILGVVYSATRPQGTVGDKIINVLVIIPEEETETFTIETDALFLRQALEEENLINGNDSAFGFYITEVKGRSANPDNQEWWAITKDGEFASVGVDELEINDGDQFELTLTIGYE